MGLSKTQMRDVLEKGGTVLYKGRLITSVAQLVKVSGTAQENASELETLRARVAELEAANTSTSGEDAGEGSGEGGGEGEIDDSSEELKKHTRTELVMKAQAEGIEVGESDTKAQIIEKILGKGK